jgi:DNA-binding HxlR family transcriptional regulator
MDRNPRTGALCPRFHRAVELIGRRWTGALLRMLMDGRRRYSDLRAAIPDISDRMLSERLRELEAEEIVRRIVTPATPVRVEYELTQKGVALEGPLREIGAWAEEWIPAPQPEEPAELPAQLDPEEPIHLDHEPTVLEP